MENEEMLNILKDHLRRYPKMQPQDVVKLLYQNEFGPGHLVSDPLVCLNRLKDEYAYVEPDNDLPLVEDIGNGMARINLAPLDAIDFSLQELAVLFMRSANHVAGEMDLFLGKLSFLKAYYEDLPFCFSYEELDDYLNDYLEQGCPVVSHSETYRQFYKPAYRVVKKEYIPGNLTVQ